MDPREANECSLAMLKFINRTGNDKVNQITKQGQDEFTVMRETYIREEQERIVNDYKSRLAQDEIKLKIQRSANENAARIQKMKKVNSLVEKLYKASKSKMVGREE